MAIALSRLLRSTRITLSLSHHLRRHLLLGACAGVKAECAKASRVAAMGVCCDCCCTVHPAFGCVPEPPADVLQTLAWRIMLVQEAQLRSGAA